MIKKRMEQAEAPTFSYLFAYDFPIDGGKVAWHCSEIPFVFHNTDRTALFNVPGETDRLQERICSAFVHFARYGNPEIASLPKWPACENSDEATMIFDVECNLRHNHDELLLKSLQSCDNSEKMTLADTIIDQKKTDAPVIRH